MRALRVDCPRQRFLQIKLNVWIAGTNARVLAGVRLRPACTGPGGCAGPLELGRNGSVDGTDFRLYGTPPEQADGRNDPGGSRFPPLRAAVHAQLFRSAAIRGRARARARRRRGPGGGRRARARTGVYRLPRPSVLELPCGHDARPGRHHQRASRAARVPRCRAPVCRHRDRADDVVRGGRRRPRVVRSRFPVPRLRDGSARRHGVLRRRRAARQPRSMAARPWCATSP